MRTLDELRREYDRLDHLLGIDTSRVELVFSTRMVRRYGECRFSHGRPVQIRLRRFWRRTRNSCFRRHGMNTRTPLPS